MAQGIAQGVGVSLNVMAIAENTAIRRGNLVTIFLISTAERNDELNLILQSPIIVILLRFKERHFGGCHTGMIQRYLLGLIHSDIAGSPPYEEPELPEVPPCDEPDLSEPPPCVDPEFADAL